MKRTIEKPNKVNHKIYICLISLFSGTLMFSFFISAGICSTLSDIIKNLSYGCVASTVVAWIIDCATTRNLNRKANSIYDAVYGELKFHIGAFIGTWAELCVVSFKEKDYQEEKHTWNDWFKIVKENYDKCTPERQAHLLNFFYRQLTEAEKAVNKSIDYLQSQRYMLTLSDVMNDAMDRILSDFRFEFYALDLDLSRKDTPEMFWSHMDAITSDLLRYIQNWPDIRYYNHLLFRPHNFFQNTNDLLAAVLISDYVPATGGKKESLICRIKKHLK